jgi:hypothetical protein
VSADTSEENSRPASRRACRWRWLGEAALFVLIVAAIGFWQTRAVPNGAAPAFRGLTADGGVQSLDAFRRSDPGSPIALHRAGWA